MGAAETGQKGRGRCGEVVGGGEEGGGLGPHTRQKKKRSKIREIGSTLARSGDGGPGRAGRGVRGGGGGGGGTQFWGGQVGDGGGGGGGDRD